MTAEQDHRRSDVQGAQALTQRLYATTDGMVWATEFCKLFLVLDRKDGTTIDEGTMVGWFANAIEIGRSAGQATAEAERDRYRRGEQTALGLVRMVQAERDALRELHDSDVAEIGHLTRDRDSWKEAERWVNGGF